MKPENLALCGGSTSEWGRRLSAGSFIHIGPEALEQLLEAARAEERARIGSPRSMVDATMDLAAAVEKFGVKVEGEFVPLLLAGDRVGYVLKSAAESLIAPASAEFSIGYREIAPPVTGPYPIGPGAPRK